MELRDLIVTPLLLITVYIVAYTVRPYLTDEVTRRYFIPALTVRIIGALAVGFIYQFYYDGGDTFNYHTHGSRHIWEAFWDSPSKGLKLFIGDPDDLTGVYDYASQIRLFGDEKSYSIIRIATLFDLVTFSTYSSTAILFSLLSFGGAWLLFKTFYTEFPHLHKWIALACLFIPSVFFWGSGILKDTVTLACLGTLTYALYRLIFKRKISLGLLFLAFGSSILVFLIKIYIMLAFIPAIVIWIFLSQFSKIRSAALRVMLVPVVLALIIALSSWGVILASKDNPQYSIENIAETARITAYDIRFYTGKDAGSGYNLGELDGSLSSFLRLAPSAIVVTMFRPYVWEGKNVLMLLSSLEALAFLLFVSYTIVRKRFSLLSGLANPWVLFTLLFSIGFAFAVGISTYNFGTLVRYKIPMMPFFAIGLILLNDHSNKAKKLDAFAATENRSATVV